MKTSKPSRKSVQCRGLSRGVGCFYLHGPVDERDLRATVQTVVDDEASSPLARSHHATALDQHQQLVWVAQRVLARVDEGLWFALCRIRL